MDPIRVTKPASWLPPESARTLLAWSDSQLAALAAKLQQVLTEWRQAWGLPAATDAVRCEAARPDRVLQEGWRMLGDKAEMAWLHVPPGGSTIAQLLFGSTPAAGALAAALADECAADGVRRLCAALGLADATALAIAPSPGSGQAWSGAVQAVLQHDLGWTVLVAAEAMQALCRRADGGAGRSQASTARAPLSSAAEAIRQRTLPVNVELAGCAIEFGTLQTLQVGDVVRLPHELDAPARVTDTGGQLLFDGFLVAQQGRKAVQLVQRAAP